MARTQISGEDAQREAIERLWPEIGDYCLARGLLGKAYLLTGNYGVPVDPAKVRGQRDQALITQNTLAARAGCMRDTIAKIEAGKRSPSPALLAAITGALGCGVRDLLLDEA